MKDEQKMQSGYYDAQNCDSTALLALIDQQADPVAFPHAAGLEKNIPLYDMTALRPALAKAAPRRVLMAEWAQVLMRGPGVLVLKAAFAQTDVLDQATEIYQNIIAQERAATGGGADHFAASGANDRVWNALQKLCLTAPEVYLRYFSNPAIDAICEAWLGPAYQMTAQVNLVHPGGAAQQAHCDYHLGFQTVETCAAYPAHVHDLSPALTLQGGIAHCDMPVASGPTKLLPYSQAYRGGYLAWRRDDVRALFEERHVQLPLAKGDAVFFNPALLHAAGANQTSDIHRMVNLLQVSSAFGRAMEAVDRQAMCSALYGPALAADLDNTEIAAVIAATAEGYSFPTNLDRDPPSGGLAPETQAALFRRALAEKMAVGDFAAQLAALADRQRP